jgi:hypothetical protein
MSYSPRRRTLLGAGLFGLLLVASLSPVPAIPAPPSQSTLDQPPEDCLLPPPPGYLDTPQKHLRQQTPFSLTLGERALLLFPHAPHLMGQTMGWKLPDRQYTEAIPLDAKTIPSELTGMPVLRFNNIEIQGERELRWRNHKAYDQWFLRDVTRKLDAVMSIHRETRKAYFFEYQRVGGKTTYMRSTESCYSCHASGPRLVRTYALPKVDSATLAEFNRKLLSYGAADFSDSVDPHRLGPALADERCSGCHNGQRRGRLYPIHLPTVAYYTHRLRAMPPGDPLDATAAGQLITAHYERHKAARQVAVDQTAAQ